MAATFIVHGALAPETPPLVYLWPVIDSNHLVVEFRFLIVYDLER